MIYTRRIPTINWKRNAHNTVSVSIHLTLYYKIANSIIWTWLLWFESEREIMYKPSTSNVFLFRFCVSFIVQYTVALTEIASCSVRYCTVSVLYVLIIVVFNAYHQLHAQFICCLSLWVVSISNFYCCQLDYYQRIVIKKIIEISLIFTKDTF